MIWQGTCGHSALSCFSQAGLLTVFAQRFSVTRVCFAQEGLLTVFGRCFFCKKPENFVKVGRGFSSVFASFSGTRRKPCFSGRKLEGLSLGFGQRSVLFGKENRPSTVISRRQGFYQCLVDVFSG